MDHNPHLLPWRTPSPDNSGAGKGFIGEHPNMVWQTRAAPPSQYENALGDALVTAFGEGVEALEPLVARLNALGVRAPDGGPWTVASFEQEMARLGA